MAGQLTFDDLLKGIQSGKSTLPRSSQRQELPELTSDDQQSLMQWALNGGISGLEYVGETLDKPRRALHGLLAGRPSELANLIPFSDAMGLTDPKQSTSGRDLLEKAGVLSKNQEGLDVGDAAGLAAEILGDPSNLIGLGIFSKVIKGAAKGARVASMASKLGDVAKGTHGVVHLHTPEVLFPNVLKIMPYIRKTKRVQKMDPSFGLPGKPLAVFGSGEKVANAIDKLWYGPTVAPATGTRGKIANAAAAVSPVPLVRRIFSPVPGIGQGAPIKMQRMLDIINDMTTGQNAEAVEKSLKLFNAMGAAKRTFNDLNNDMLGGQSVLFDVSAKAVSSLADEKPGLKKFLLNHMGLAQDPPGGLYAHVSPSQSAKIKLMEGVSAAKENLKEYGTSIDEYNKKFADIRDAIIADRGGKVLSPYDFDNTVRMIAELRPGDGTGLLDHVSDVMKKAGISDELRNFDDARNALHSLADTLREIPPAMQSDLKRLGLNTPDLWDYYIDYAHRRPGIDRVSKGMDKVTRSLIKLGQFPFQNQRDDYYRHVSGGAKVANDLTSDVALSGGFHDKGKAAQAAFDNLSLDSVGEPQYRSKPNQKMMDMFEQSRRAGVSFDDVKAAAKEIRDAKVQGYAETVKPIVDNFRTFFDTMRMTRVMREHPFVKGNNSWQVAIRKIAAGDMDNIPGFDDFVRNHLPAETGMAMEPQDVWEILSREADPSSRFRAPRLHELSDEAVQKVASAKKAAKDAGDDSFNVDEFDDLATTAEGQLKLKPTLWNRIRYMVQASKKSDPNGVGIPAFYDHDEIVRREIAAGKAGNPEWQALAADKDVTDYALFERMQNDVYSQAGINNSMSLADVQSATHGTPYNWIGHYQEPSEFVADFVQNHPQLSQIPFWGQDKLEGFAKHLWSLPPVVRESGGIFNRGTVTDAIDYLMDAVRARSGLQSIHEILSHPEIVKHKSADTGGVPLHEFWFGIGKDKQQLTDIGLINLMARREGIDPSKLDDAMQKSLLQKSTELMVPPEVGQTIRKMYDVYTDAGTRNVVETMIDRLNALTKANFTMPFAQFHNRNLFGGQVANFMDGTWSGDSLVDANDLFKGGGLDNPELRDILQEVYVQNIFGAGEGGGSSKALKLNASYNEAQAPGAIEGSVFKYVTNPFGEVVRGYREAGGGWAGAKSAMFGSEGKDGTLYPGLFNFQSVKGGYDPVRGAQRVGDVNPHTGAVLTKMERNTSDVTNNAVVKAGENMNDWVEWMNRVAPYIHLRRNGHSPFQAAQRVKKVQFNYSEMSDAERNYFKRIFLFYSFARKNLQNQMELLVRRPGGPSAQAIRAINSVREESSDDYAPRQLREGFSYRMGKNADGSEKFYSQSGLFPFEEAFNRFAFNPQGFDVRRTAEKVASGFNPLLRGGIEAFTGKQMYSGRPTSELYQYPTDNPDANFVLGLLPTARAVSTFRQLVDPRKTLADKAFNVAFGGARITDVDVEKQKALEARDALESALKKNPQVGSFTTVYPKDIENLSPDAAKKLKMYNLLRRKVRDINAKRSKQKQTSG